MKLTFKNLKHKSLMSLLIMSFISAASMSLPSISHADDDKQASAKGMGHEYARNTALENSNKRIITLMTNNMLNGSDLNQLGRFFARKLIQHDATIADGREAMLNSIYVMRQVQPAQAINIKHILADGDLVFVQSQLSATPDNLLSGINRYDIYRLDHGVVVEHWLVKNKVSSRTANGNSVFNDAYQYPLPKPALPSYRIELNRLLVRGLSDEVFGQRNFDLLNRFWATAYAQHNPGVANGRAALAAVIEYIAPVGGAYKIKQVIADDDKVLVCAQTYDPGTNQNDEFGGYAVCDMYRVANLELVEHWDSYQAVAPTSVNGHTMFSSLYRGHVED